MKKIMLLLVLVASIPLFAQKNAIWPAAKANQWYAKQDWPLGCNFIPSTAVNELEMWQTETFDTATINKELGWAQGIGMNTVRVFLHFLPWKSDAKGFKNRMDRYLAIAAHNHIKTIFVLFDDCWNPDPVVGIQPEPKTGVHNSGWMQCPGKQMHNDSSSWFALGLYTKDILGSFAQDKRILMWDLYNEPGNSGYNESTLPLLKKIFAWAWQIRPSQPLTCGIWYDNKALNDWQLGASDVISFHNYGSVDQVEKQINELAASGRPLICTEYMARPRGSLFETHLPVFKKYKTGAINWGLVSGKTNTMYAWNTPMPDGKEPAVWFHDIFRKNGTAYDPRELEIIRKYAGK